MICFKKVYFFLNFSIMFPPVISFKEKSKKYKKFLFRPLLSIFYFTLLLVFFLLSPLWFLCFFLCSLVASVFVLSFVCLLPVLLLGVSFLFLGTFFYYGLFLAPIVLVVFLGYYIAKHTGHLSSDGLSCIKKSFRPTTPSEEQSQESPTEKRKQ